MWLSDTSVKRPVFATVLSLALIAFGALSFRELTVREYPDVVDPVLFQITRENIERVWKTFDEFI